MSLNFAASRTFDAVRYLRRVGSTLALLVFGIAAAHAQNIVPNPNLDTQLPPWAQFVSASPDPVGVGTIAWSASPDVDNNPNSGSALETMDATTKAVNAAAGMSQCVPFASTSVNFINYGMSVLVPASDTADGGVDATIEVRLYSDTACKNFLAGGSQGRTVVNGVPSDTTWYTLGDNNFVISPAQTAQSAEIRAYLRQTAAASAAGYKVYFDKFHLVLNSTTPVRLQEFSVD